MAEKNKTALVLAAGGVFGAYQVGVWKALADSFRPDLVVGASIGAINGWLIAGGCPVSQLEDLWFRADRYYRLPLRPPRCWWQGWFDNAAIRTDLAALMERFRPVTAYAVVATDMKRLRPRLFTGDEVRLEHLLASCAVPVAFDFERIGGRWYGDGGLTGPLPLWAAAELGATRMIAVEPLPKHPAMLGWLASAAKAIAGAPAGIPDSVEVVRIAPNPPLGSFGQLLSYRPDRIRAWIDAGERDGQRLRTSVLRCVGPAEGPASNP